MILLPVLNALRFRDRSTSELEAVPASAWPSLLRATDEQGLTLPLGIRCRDLLPDTVRQRIDRNLADNEERHHRLIAAHREVQDALEQRGIDFAVLKGLSKWPYYTDEPGHRAQYDIDLLFPEGAISGPLHIVEDLGYEALQWNTGDGSDHLPRMIRKTGWTWRNNYFDPDMLPAMELHFRLWDEGSEHFGVGDLSPFWNRRMIRECAGLRLPALHPVDGLSYSALHLIRHMLRGGMQISHVYEMAHFLERSSTDDAFWAEWQSSGVQSCRLVEGIAFRLAREWFRCRLHPAARMAVEQLPRAVDRWFELFAMSPAQAVGRGNKNELWLHFCLVSSARDRRKIAMRRLFPVHPGRVIMNTHVRPEQITLLMRAKDAMYGTTFLVRRAVHHLRVILPVIRSGIRWWRARPGLS